MILYKYSDQTTDYLDGVRKWFPNKSLPATITEEVVLELGIEIEEIPEPEAPEPYVPTLEEVQMNKIGDILTQSNARIAMLREGYSNGEIDTFAQQYSGALYILGRGGAREDSLFITTLLSKRLNRIPNTSELEGFSSLIIANYNSAKEALVEVIGTQQRLELAVRNATTTEEVEAIVWSD